MNDALREAVDKKLGPVTLAAYLKKQSEVIPDLDIEDEVPQPTAQPNQPDAKVEIVPDPTENKEDEDNPENPSVKEILIKIKLT